MILVIGDVHGDIDRLKNGFFRKLKKGDAVIVCGDFGCIWDGSDKEKKLLKKLGKRPYSILFAEGAHENFEELETYPTEQWCGGLTRVISGNLRQLVRGHVFEISGKKIFVFGGGSGEENGGTAPCSEKLRFRYESPEESELAEADERLAACGGEVDYIVSYEPPQSIAEFINVGASQADKVSAYLEKTKNGVKFTRWFFGKYHQNKFIPPRFAAVFDKVIDAETLR